MSKHPELPSGIRGFRNEHGDFVPTGSQMGRRDDLPDDRSIAVRLRLVRLKFYDYAYDKGGAYWGSGNPIWYAWNHEGSAGNEDCINIFTRAATRLEAKSYIRKLLPNCKFYQ